jgi:hypothetical protein|tara:strand:+ start:87 stop:401 length:315 start_codon:yes stop_codon:yes gene_type:complete
MSNQYPPSGVLFTNNNKKTPNQPDYTGDLELSDEVINDLVEQMSRGNPKPKLRLAGWKKTSKKTGATFVSLTGSMYQESNQKKENADGFAPPRAQAAVADDPPF